MQKRVYFGKKTGYNLATRHGGRGSSFPRSLSLRSVSPHKKIFTMAKLMIFLKKNEWTDVDLNRWFEESDLDVEQLAAAAVRAIEDWLDEDTVEFEPDEGGISEG